MYDSLLKLVVEALHGSNIYPECCSMKVEFCKKERLTVKRNDNISWDFTIKISEGDEPRVAKRTLLDNPPMEKPMYHNTVTTGTGSVIIITIIHVIIVRIIDRMEDRQVEAELGRPKRPADPNKVLLVSVLNQLIPIYCDVAYRAFSQFGTVVRVAIFNRVTVQVNLAFFSPPLPFSHLFFLFRAFFRFNPFI